MTTKSGPQAARIAATISGREARAVGHVRPAVAVVADIGAVPQELVEEITVRRVDLDARRADLLRDQRRADEAVADLRQLGQRRRASARGRDAPGPKG